MDWLLLAFVLLGYICIWLSGWHLAFYLAALEWVLPDKKRRFRRRQMAWCIVFGTGALGWLMAAVSLMAMKGA